MSIDNALLTQVTGVDAPRPFSCQHLGLVTSDRPDTLTFLDSERFVPTLLDNGRVTAALVTTSLGPALENSRIDAIVCDDPRYHFFTLRNHLARAGYRREPSRIATTARVHPRAYVADHNVVIGAGTVVEAHATVLPDVQIGADCTIRAGAVLGSEGFEHKRTSRGLLAVFHDGRVRIGDGVEIGANSCVDKGFAERDTVIGDGTRIDNLVHIAHGVHLGRQCLVVAAAMVAGTVDVGDEAWIGPNASVGSQLGIGRRGFVSIGSVVTRHVEPDQHVSGNFAIEHRRFLEFLRSIR